MRKIAFAMTLVMVFGISVLAEAALIDRGSGLIYCDTLDITWLHNANYASKTMNWVDAKSWIDAFTYDDSVRDVTWDDWRLPTALDENGLPPTTREARGSEMGHLFYEELGGVLWSSILSSSDPDLDLFENIQESAYWTSTFFGNYGLDYAWVTYFSSGWTKEYNENAPFYAWAVRDGDVGAAPVPVPGTILFLVSGLLGVMGVNRFGRRHG